MNAHAPAPSSSAASSGAAAAGGARAPLVRAEDVTVRFESRDATVQAVNSVSFTLDPGEVLCILGESGSGKSVTLRALMRLLPPRRSVLSGRIEIGGHDVLAMSERALADLRGTEVGMIFQEPMVAFDPVYSVGRQITETIIRHEGGSREEARRRALDLLERVRIPSPTRRLRAYPHELSGGMRQRAMIALALSCRPSLLLADEPTTALDATVQIQILLLLRELQRELGMAVIFVTHDVGVAVEIADRIAVMYGGRFVETGPVRQIMRDPRHPYTQGLLTSTVHGSLRGTLLEAIPGSPPDMTRLPPGCAFAARCRFGAAVRVPAARRRAFAPPHGALRPPRVAPPPCFRLTTPSRPETSTRDITIQHARAAAGWPLRGHRRADGRPLLGQRLWAPSGSLGRYLRGPHMSPVRCWQVIDMGGEQGVWKFLLPHEDGAGA